MLVSTCDKFQDIDITVLQWQSLCYGHTEAESYRNICQYCLYHTRYVNFLTSIHPSGPTPSTVTVSHCLLRMNFLAVELFPVAMVTGTCHRRDSNPARKDIIIILNIIQRELFSTSNVHKVSVPCSVNCFKGENFIKLISQVNKYKAILIYYHKIQSAIIADTRYKIQLDARIKKIDP